MAKATVDDVAAVKLSAEPDVTDNTNITIEVGDRQPSGSSCAGQITSRLAKSSLVRYLVAAAIVGLLIFILERFLGAATVTDQLRVALANYLSAAAHAAAAPLAAATSPPASAPTKQNG
jgi:hypothetical protein